MLYVDNFRINFDIFCDFVPIVSTVTNAIDLVQKKSLQAEVSKKPFQKHTYSEYISNKNSKACWFLLIPIINIVVAVALRLGTFEKTNQKTNENLQSSTTSKKTSKTTDTKNVSNPDPLSKKPKAGPAKNANTNHKPLPKPPTQGSIKTATTPELRPTTPPGSTQRPTQTVVNPVPGLNQESNSLDPIHQPSNQAQPERDEDQFKNVFEKGTNEELAAFLLEETSASDNTFFAQTLLTDLDDDRINRLLDLNSEQPQITNQIFECVGFLCKQDHEQLWSNHAKKLFHAYFQDNPNSDLWDTSQWTSSQLSGNGIGQFTLLLAQEKTILILDRPIDSTHESLKMIEDIASNINSFRYLFEKKEAAEMYIHRILSHLIEINAREGVEFAESRLKIFTWAFVPPVNGNPKSIETYLLNYYALRLITRSAHLDEQPISKCCEHLPISPEFKLTPIIIKTLITGYAKNHSRWNDYLVGQINSEEHARAFIEAAKELPLQQRNLFLTAVNWWLHKKFDLKRLVQDILGKKLSKILKKTPIREREPGEIFAALFYESPIER